MLGAFLLLACNRIFVVCFFGVRAHEADRRAELALRGIRWERGRLVCDSYSPSLWLFFSSIDGELLARVFILRVEETWIKLPDVRTSVGWHILGQYLQSCRSSHTMAILTLKASPS